MQITEDSLNSSLQGELCIRFIPRRLWSFENPIAWRYFLSSNINLAATKNWRENLHDFMENQKII